MKPVRFAILAALCLVLPACGGEGSGTVASTPAPVPTQSPTPSPSPSPTPSPTPPPATVTTSSVVVTPLADRAGLVAGIYQPIAIAYDRANGSQATQTVGAQSVRIVDSAAIKLTANPSANSYTLEMNVTGFPVQKVLDLTKTTDDDGKVVDSHFGNHVVQTDIYSDGTRKVSEYDVDRLDAAEPIKDLTAKTATIDYYGIDLGLRYVSFGYWAQDDLEHIGTGYHSGSFHGSRKVYFVFGRRTAANELPTTGTATYAGTLSPDYTVDYSGYSSINTISLKLTANFASRLIDAVMTAKAMNGSDFDAEYRGLSATGSGPVSASGAYGISLAGTTFDPNNKDIRQVTSTLSGAFFGPGAEETGGVFKIDQDSNTLLFGTYAFPRTVP